MSRPLDDDVDPVDGVAFLLHWCLVLLFLLGFILRVFVVFLGRFEGDTLEGAAEHRRSDRPGDGLAVVGPTEVIGAHVGEFFQRHGGFFNVYFRSLATNRRHCDEIQLVAHARQNPTSVRADAHVVGAHRLLGKVESRPGQLKMFTPVGAIESERGQTVFLVHPEAPREVEVDPLGVPREVRFAESPRGNDEIGITAVGRNPDDVQSRDLPKIDGACEPLVKRAAERNDPRAVRGPNRIAVKGPHGRQSLVARSVGTDFPDLSSLTSFAGPGRVSDPLAVGRPPGLKPMRSIGEEQARRAARKLHDVKPGERRERDTLSIRRGCRVLDDAGTYRPFFDAARKMKPRSQLLRHLGAEWNDA